MCRQRRRLQITFWITISFHKIHQVPLPWNWWALWKHTEQMRCKTNDWLLMNPNRAETNGRMPCDFQTQRFLQERKRWRLWGEKYISCATLGGKKSKLGGGDSSALERLHKCRETESAGCYSLWVGSCSSTGKIHFHPKGYMEQNTFWKAMQPTTKQEKKDDFCRKFIKYFGKMYCVWFLKTETMGFQYEHALNNLLVQQLTDF